MPRTWFVCLTIVAAFSSPLFAAAPATTVLAPVSGTVLAIARTVGLAPDRDRVRFLPDFVRLTHSGAEARAALLDPLRQGDPRPDSAGGLVVVPLDAAVWSDAIFRRPVSIDQLLPAIVAERRAAWLGAGLATLDDETLAYLSQKPLLLAELYERAAAPFAAFAASVQIRGGRLVPPGDEDDHVIWEAVVGAPLDAPDRFIAALFTSPGGRLAYLYGTAAAFDRARVRFLTGRFLGDRAVRIERLRSLALLLTTHYGEWRLDRFPYARPINDFAMLLARLRVDETGQMLPPADQAFWTEIWGSATLPGPAVVDAAWLAQATTVGTMFTRGERLDQVAFAQRVFGDARPEARADVLASVRAFPRQKMLMLTLERMGLRSPAVLAEISRRVSLISLADANRTYWVMAQLQSALAILSRMTAAGTVARRPAESLVRSLFAVSLDDQGRYAGGLARWIARELSPLLPESTDLDTSVLLAMAGPSPGRSAPRVKWEGETYRIDFAAAELRRLRAVRAKQGGPTLALAGSLERAAAILASRGLTEEGVAEAERQLREAAIAHADGLDSSIGAADLATLGIAVPRRHRETLERILADLVHESGGRDLRRAARQAAPLRELVDVVLGQALLATAYAADLGDPDGPALLTRHAALRHDFGFARLDNESRSRVAWAVPRQDFQPGVAWHVTGSVLGLDIALARLALTRINSDRISDAPRIPSIERDGFAVNLALLDVRGLRDDMRDAIAEALAKGTALVARAVTDRTNAEWLTPLADRLRLNPLRRRSLALAAAETPDRVAQMLTLTELVQLGGGPTAGELAPWGVSALVQTGCPCTHVVLPDVWAILQGRAQLPLASSAVPDLHLRIADRLAELRLPAVLARPVLAAAIQDFLEDARPADGGDWWGLALAARAVTRERVEDYVAAAAAVGGALVPVDEDWER